MKSLPATLNEHLAAIPPVDKRWYRAMDDVAARILDLMEEQQLTQESLATRMGKHKSYVNRVLSGGVNLTLKTIAEFEEALGAPIIEVVPVKREVPARRRPNRTPPAHNS